MKKILFLLWCLPFVCFAQTQKEEWVSVPMSFDTVGADTARAIQIVDRYLGMIDFMNEKTDSVLFVTSYVVDQAHLEDTMIIYRWYKAPHSTRIEIWSHGKLDDGYYTDGTGIFRSFHRGRREWANITQHSFYNNIISLDIRGALYDWRSKGSELYYAGEFNYKGRPLDRVFVISPACLDRYYFFEKYTGLLAMVVEDMHIFGDATPKGDVMRVDWRTWNEFTPVHWHYLPSTESYRVGQQVVVIKNTYSYKKPSNGYFTEDYYR